MGRAPAGLLSPSAALPVAALALVALFATLATYTPVANSDIWMHLRLGQELAAGADIPDVESWSATARGRRYIAHEWLAARTFYALYARGGGAALTLVRVWAALLIALAMFFSLTREGRRAPLVGVIFSLGLVLVLARLHVRPHLFSLLLAAWLVASLEWWRHRRRFAALAWFAVPQVLWANLHGAFLLAPALLVVTGLAAVACARFPALGRAPDGEPFTTREALQPLAAAGLLLVVGLLNPYGPSLYLFSLEMVGANDFIKSSVYEWLPALSSAHHQTWGFWVFGVWMLALAGTLVFRRERLSLIDGALVLVTVGLALSAVRFVPYAALVGVPVLARGWADAKPRLAFTSVVVSAGLCLFMLVTGPNFRLDTHASFGAGLELPKSAPAFAALKKAGVTGAVFAEYHDGAYLLFAGGPELLPVMDGRIDVYGDALYQEFRAARSEPGALAPYADRHEVQAIVVRNPGPGTREIIAPLLADPRWQVGPKVEGWAILVRAQR